MDNQPKPNMRLAVPFFGVADMDASLRFYVDGLGFTMTKQWIPRGKIEWCWLERDAVALMLQCPRADKPPPADLVVPPEPPPPADVVAPPEPVPPPKTGPAICCQCE